MVDNKMTMQGLGGMALGILALIVIVSIIPMIGDSIDTAASVPVDTAATGALSFTGIITDGDLINISSGGSNMIFELNSSGNAASAGNIEVNLTSTSSVLASGALTTKINANATLAVLLTAVNTTNTTTLTADAIGSTYNSIGLWEDGANMSWSHATMTGGVDGSPWGADSIPTGAGMWSTLGPFIQLAAIILIVAGFLTTLKGLKKEN